MKKYLILTVVSICLAYLMAKIIFMEYQSDKVIALSNYKDKYYFLQLGVYSNYESMLDNSSSLANYIYMVDDDKYYVFGCISEDESNMDKIEAYYKSKGFDTYVKEFDLSDDELKETVDKIDLLMKETTDGIYELCKQSISKYKEG